jgi:cyclopropane-fatty-acyl-phospholipid synthase
MEEMGEDYARTLEVWRQRFLSRLDEVRALGFDEVFIRMWDFYLCYCQGAFEERVIGTSQFLFARPEWRQNPHQKQASV